MPPRLIYEHSGPAELVLEGENLTPDTLKLYHNGVLYTPLESSDTYAYFLLGDNGTNKVMLNGKNYCTVIIKDIIVPQELPARINLFQKSGIGIDSGNTINSKAVIGNCINYPYKVNQEYPNYLLLAYVGESVSEDWELINCSINGHQYDNNPSRLNVSVNDPTKTAYIKYKGFIIAVFNYSA